MDADDPANGQIAQRAPLRGDRHSRPTRQIIFKMTGHRVRLVAARLASNASIMHVMTAHSGKR
jgi:hypothetical protein